MVYGTWWQGDRAGVVRPPFFRFSVVVVVEALLARREIGLKKDPLQHLLHSRSDVSTGKFIHDQEQLARRRTATNVTALKNGFSK